MTIPGNTPYITEMQTKKDVSRMKKFFLANGIIDMILLIGIIVVLTNAFVMKSDKVEMLTHPLQSGEKISLLFKNFKYLCMALLLSKTIFSALVVFYLIING